jgi:hypothetical protein
MRKGPVPKPKKQRAPDPASAKRKAVLNPALNTQTRKVLVKHYRAKYGVR